jgi:hypothetical protein
VTPARFSSLLFTALALAPALAHLFELPNKIGLRRVYGGWALLGILTRRRPAEFRPALLGFLCIVGAQVIFWTFTYPTNQATDNWTVLPDNRMALRTQWAYSHAASAALNLIVVLGVIRSVLASKP